MCWALTEAPGGSQRPMWPRADGSSGQETAPPEEGLPRRTISPQVGIIAQRPMRALNMVKTIPEVNIVSARISQDSTNGSSQRAQPPVDDRGDAEASEQGVGQGEGDPLGRVQGPGVHAELNRPDEADDHRGQRDVEQRQPARIALLERLDVPDRDVHADRPAHLRARHGQHLRPPWRPRRRDTSSSTLAAAGLRIANSCCSSTARRAWPYVSYCVTCSEAVQRLLHPDDERVGRRGVAGWMPTTAMGMERGVGLAMA